MCCCFFVVVFFFGGGGGGGGGDKVGGWGWMGKSSGGKSDRALTDIIVICSVKKTDSSLANLGKFSHWFRKSIALERSTAIIYCSLHDLRNTMLLFVNDRKQTDSELSAENRNWGVVSSVHRDWLITSVTQSLVTRYLLTMPVPQSPGAVCEQGVGAGFW